MKKWFLSAVLFCSLMANAQITINDPGAETRAVSGFHGIQVENGIELLLSPGQEESVVVSASSDEYRSRIITKVENGMLIIKYQNQKGLHLKSDKRELKAYVAYKQLDKLTAGTGAAVHLTQTLETDKLDLDLNTGANLEGEIRAKEIKLVQSTGAKIQLGGSALTFTMDANTGGKFEGEHFSADQCTVTASTGAKVALQVNRELNADVNTGAKIRYNGAPTNVIRKENTGGRISKI